MTGNTEEQVGSSPMNPDSRPVSQPVEPTPDAPGKTLFQPDRDGTESASVASPTTGNAADPEARGSDPESPVGWTDARPERQPSALIPALLGLAVLLLFGAVLYLYSALPDPSRTTAMETELGSLRKQVAGLAERPQADLSGLTGRIDGTEADLKGMKAAAAALQSRIDALPTAPPAPNTDWKGPLDDLASKVAAAAQADKEAQQRNAALGDKLVAVDAQASALKTSVENLDKRVAPIEAERVASKSADRVTEARQNGSAAETRAAPLAVTAQAVLRAVDAGQPFAADLAVLKTLGADPAALERLKDVADTGAPTTKDLRAALSTLRDQIVAEAAPAPSGSYMDRLMAGAATLVQVRPLGSVVGDAPAAVAARLDDDLARDDLAAALAEWQKLPEASRAAGKSLAERIRLRQSAQIAARTIGGDAIKAMAAAQQ